MEEPVTGGVGGQFIAQAIRPLRVEGAHVEVADESRAAVAQLAGQLRPVPRVSAGQIDFQPADLVEEQPLAEDLSLSVEARPAEECTARDDHDTLWINTYGGSMTARRDGVFTHEWDGASARG